MLCSHSLNFSSEYDTLGLRLLFFHGFFTFFSVSNPEKKRSYPRLCIFCSSISSSGCLKEKNKHKKTNIKNHQDRQTDRQDGCTRTLGGAGRRGGTALPPAPPAAYGWAGRSPDAGRGFGPPWREAVRRGLPWEETGTRAEGRPPPRVGRKAGRWKDVKTSSVEGSFPILNG